MYGTVPTGKLLRYNANFSTSIIDHNLMTYPYKVEVQHFVCGGLQLRRRFERVSVRFFIQVKHGTYNPPSAGSKGPQHVSLLGPGGKIRCSTSSDGISSTILGGKNGESLVKKCTGKY